MADTKSLLALNPEIQAIAKEVLAKEKVGVKETWELARVLRDGKAKEPPIAPSEAKTDEPTH